MLPAVFSRDVQRLGVYVSRNHGGGGCVVCYGDGYSPSAGTDIHDGQHLPRIVFGELEDLLHQQLSLLPGYQYAGIDHEIQSEELSVAGEIGKGRAGRSLCDQL